MAVACARTVTCAGLAPGMLPVTAACGCNLRSRLGFVLPSRPAVASRRCVPPLRSCRRIPPSHPAVASHRRIPPSHPAVASRRRIPPSHPAVASRRCVPPLRSAVASRRC
eukprot:113507-Chlamydomonas_euryale.AAC.2